MPAFLRWLVCWRPREIEVFGKVVSVAEKAGKHVALLAVAGTNPWLAIVQTAIIHSGRGSEILNQIRREAQEKPNGLSSDSKSPEIRLDSKLSTRPKEGTGSPASKGAIFANTGATRFFPLADG
jgi:hypothetical protein